MRALHLAARYLHVDDPVVESRPRQQHARHCLEGLLRPRLADLDLAQSALQAGEMIGQEYRPFPEELEDFVDRVAELESTILDDENALVGAGEAAVEPENVGHQTAFTMTTARA